MFVLQEVNNIYSFSQDPIKFQIKTWQSCKEDMSLAKHNAEEAEDKDRSVKNASAYDPIDSLRKILRTYLDADINGGAPRILNLFFKPKFFPIHRSEGVSFNLSVNSKFRNFDMDDANSDISLRLELFKTLDSFFEECRSAL